MFYKVFGDFRGGKAVLLLIFLRFRYILNEIFDKLTNTFVNKINKNIIIICILAIAVSILVFCLLDKKQMTVRDFVLPYGMGSLRVSEWGTVTASGTWVASNQREGHDFLHDQVNTVNIYCYKDTEKCHEIRAMLSRLNKQSRYDLFALNFEYDIKEWTADHIKAEMSGPGRIFELDMNFNNQKVLLSIRDNPNNSTASAYINTATLENAYNVWDSLQNLNK